MTFLLALIITTAVSTGIRIYRHHQKAMIKKDQVGWWLIPEYDPTKGERVYKTNMERIDAIRKYEEDNL